MGVTWATFKESGNTPVFIDKFINDDHKRLILNDYHSHNFKTHTEGLAFTWNDKPDFQIPLSK